MHKYNSRCHEAVYCIRFWGRYPFLNSKIPISCQRCATSIIDISHRLLTSNRRCDWNKSHTECSSTFDLLLLNEFRWMKSAIMLCWTSLFTGLYKLFLPHLLVRSNYHRRATLDSRCQRAELLDANAIILVHIATKEGQLRATSNNYTLWGLWRWSQMLCRVEYMVAEDVYSSYLRWCHCIIRLIKNSETTSLLYAMHERISYVIAMR